MRLTKKRVISIGATAISARILATMLFVAGLTAGSVRAQTTAPEGALNEQQVLALQKKFQDASMAADMPTLSALMADDATFIHGSGLVQTKAQYINSITSGQMKLSTYELKESKVVFFKGGAIVVGLTDVGLAPPPNAAPGTPPRLLHMRISTVWLRKLDGWQLILNQGTPLAGPPPAAASH
jgi:ketosteroid isomerase-like protein